MAAKKWEKGGDYFRLDVVEYRPQVRSLWVRFKNRDVGEAPVSLLWLNRPGAPDWARVQVDPDSRSALLVPTLPGQATTEGEVAEIPGDVVRAATDIDFRAYVVARQANWAKEVGRELAEMRETQDLTRRQLASQVGMEPDILAGIESGRIEPSLVTVAKLLEAMGRRLQDLAVMKTG